MTLRRLVLVLALCAVGAALLYQLHRQQLAVTPPRGTASEQPRYTVDDAHWTRYDADGQPSLVGDVGHAEYFDDGSGIATDLKLTALSLRGAPWVATAPHGQLPASGGEILLQGPVRLTGRWPDNDTPLLLTTSDLWLAPESHQLHTQQPVQVSGPGRDGSAVGARGDWALQDLELLSDVRMKYDAPTH